jgi:hypothetical protein
MDKLVFPFYFIYRIILKYLFTSFGIVNNLNDSLFSDPKAYSLKKVALKLNLVLQEVQNKVKR